VRRRVKTKRAKQASAAQKRGKKKPVCPDQEKRSTIQEKEARSPKHILDHWTKKQKNRKRQKNGSGFQRTMGAVGNEPGSSTSLYLRKERKKSLRKGTPREGKQEWKHGVVVRWSRMLWAKLHRATGEMGGYVTENVTHMGIRTNPTWAEGCTPGVAGCFLAANARLSATGKNART